MARSGINLAALLAEPGLLTTRGAALFRLQSVLLSANSTTVIASTASTSGYATRGCLSSSAVSDGAVQPLPRPSPNHQTPATLPGSCEPRQHSALHAHSARSFASQSSSPNQDHVEGSSTGADATPGPSGHSSESDNLEELLLSRAMRQVPGLGWSHAAMTAAARELNLSPAVAGEYCKQALSLFFQIFWHLMGCALSAFGTTIEPAYNPGPALCASHAKP